MDPFVVPAHSGVEIDCEASTHELGAFRCPMYLAYDDGGFIRVELSVTGTAVVPRVADHAPKSP